MYRSIVVIACGLVVCGCATEQNYATAVSSWEGATSQQLTKVWGYPDEKTSHNGNTLYLYRSHEKGKNPVTTIPGSTSVVTDDGSTKVYSTPSYSYGGGTYSLDCSTWFEIDPKGVIVQTSYRGNNCLGNADFLSKYQYSTTNTK